jgi:hypothetical protein
MDSIPASIELRADNPMKTKLIFILTILFITSAVYAAADEPGPGSETPPVTDSGPATSDEPAGPMTAARLGELVQAVDANANNQGNSWQFVFQKRPFVVVFDEKADRMRMFTLIGPEKLLTPDLMRRMLQANFDSALDARYAVGNELIWGVFIHPLSPLDQDQFASAVVQILNVATSFGNAFSSGLFTYGGGDSVEENRKMLEELQKRINPTI